MVTTTSIMKRPVIFLKDLSQEDIAALFSYSESFKPFYERYCSDSTQIYVHRSGCLGAANTITIHDGVEVTCTTYQEFLTKWEQYKLWMILQDSQ